MQLFWRKGYESSSLQELLNTMGLSKSSFYQTFKSKHALFENCIKHYRQTLGESLVIQLEKSSSGKAFINKLFQNVADETCGADARRGCLLMNTASEFAQSDADIARLVTNSLQNIIDVFEMAIQRAQQAGEISADKDPHALATYLISSMSGLKNMVKAGADRQTVKQIADTVVSTLN